jgi:hypothetical protein
VRRHHVTLAALSCVAIAAVITVGGVTVNEGALERDLVRLPEHDGLAARYPNDQGLATDPSVVLADGFEGPMSLWTRTIGKREVTERPEHVHAGRRALELTIQGPAATGLEKYVNAGLHRLFLRYYLKYDDTFPGAHHVGGMLSARAPGVSETAPGIKADGTNKFAVALDHWPLIPTCGPRVCWWRTCTTWTSSTNGENSSTRPGELRRESMRYGASSDRRSLLGRTSCPRAVSGTV